MGKLGGIIKSKFPGVYHLLVNTINYFLRLAKPFSIYITDSLGGSFKNYFVNNDMASKISLLKSGLDKESNETIDIILQRLLNYPDERYKQKTAKKKEVIGGLLPAEAGPYKALIMSELKKYKHQMPHISANIEESVFYFFHGLRLLPEKVTQYIKGGDFMDIGAFIGDSSIALMNYDYKKVYAVEISAKSINQYKNNMARSGIQESRFEVIHAGISSEDTDETIKIADTGSAGLSSLRNTGKYDEITVPLKTLNSIVAQYKIEPRFIKVDIEGNGFAFTKGAIDTIRRFRPVLSIAIYHNPQEFFEIKPFLEKSVEGYEFMIRKLSCGIKNNQCHSEIILLGYPGEIVV
jgi:FkbM family methyltransferase